MIGTITRGTSHTSVPDQFGYKAGRLMNPHRHPIDYIFFARGLSDKLQVTYKEDGKTPGYGKRDMFFNDPNRVRRMRATRIVD